MVGAQVGLERRLGMPLRGIGGHKEKVGRKGRRLDLSSPKCLGREDREGGRREGACGGKRGGVDGWVGRAAEGSWLLEEAEEEASRSGAGSGVAASCWSTGASTNESLRSESLAEETGSPVGGAG